MSYPEVIDYVVHEAREVPPWVREAIEQVRDADFYGNTGRSNKKPWVRMTREILRKGGILKRFRRIFFKPDGVSTKVSKAAGVGEIKKRHPKGIHVEDNPEDGLFIAGLYPDVQVLIVQDLTTGVLYSEKETRRFPNAKRVATLKEALKLP